NALERICPRPIRVADWCGYTHMYDPVSAGRARCAGEGIFHWSPMMRDPYDVLGVPKNASAEAIKTAFRRLAKKLHPDANKQDKKAASKFAEVNAAYEILGDEDKRKAFDRGEIDAEGKPRFQGFEGFGAGGGPRAGGFNQGGFGQGGGFESFTF